MNAPDGNLHFKFQQRQAEELEEQTLEDLKFIDTLVNNFVQSIRNDVDKLYKENKPDDEKNGSNLTEFRFYQHYVDKLKSVQVHEVMSKLKAKFLEQFNNWEEVRNSNPSKDVYAQVNINIEIARKFQRLEDKIYDRLRNAIQEIYNQYIDLKAIQEKVEKGNDNGKKTPRGRGERRLGHRAIK